MLIFFFVYVFALLFVFEILAYSLLSIIFFFFRNFKLTKMYFFFPLINFKNSQINIKTSFICDNHNYIHSQNSLLLQKNNWAFFHLSRYQIIITFIFIFFFFLLLQNIFLLNFSFNLNNEKKKKNLTFICSVLFLHFSIIH